MTSVPRLPLASPTIFSGATRVAVGEFDEVLLAVAPDPQEQLAGQRVDDGDADAVQSAGDLVGILVEFSAGVQLGHDDFGRGNAFTLVNVDGNAAAVVAHGDRTVGVEDDVDRAVACPASASSMALSTTS